MGGWGGGRGQPPAVRPPSAYLDGWCPRKDGGHCIQSQVAYTAAPLEAGGCEAHCIDASGNWAPSAHSPWAAARPAAGVHPSVGTCQVRWSPYQVQPYRSPRTLPSRAPWTPNLCIPLKLSLPPTHIAFFHSTF